MTLPFISAPLAPAALAADARAEKVSSAWHTPGFFATAQDYLDMRGGTQDEQMILTYTVQTRKPMDTALSDPEKTTLIVGPDYVASRSGGVTRIYDFKLNRLLTIKPTPESQELNDVIGLNPGASKPPKALIFENVSLYASAVRNISTIGRLTQNGAVSTIPASGKTEKPVSVVWAESAIGYSAKDRSGVLSIRRDNDRITADLDGRDTSIFTGDYAGDSFPSEAHRDAFFVFAHHNLPIHPQILRETYSMANPPKVMEIMIASPGNAEGRVERWTLDTNNIVRAPFPLSPSTKSTTERETVSPIAFVVNQAVRGQAFGGKPPSELILLAMNTAAMSEDWGNAWLISETYLEAFGPCEADAKDTACKAVTSVRRQAQWDAETGQIKALTRAANDASLPRTARTKALADVLPKLSNETANARLLRLAGQARAKLKGQDITVADVAALNTESLLQRALVQNPYDTQTYKVMAQIYAATGRYEQAWDIYDALRSGLFTGEAEDLAVNNVEQNTKARAPAYFLPEP